MIVFLTDTHIGVNRRANTTTESRKRMTRRVIDAPVEAVENLLDQYHEFRLFCAGDLFDKFSNKEEVILDACELYEHIDLCLAGNHDVINDSSKKSSLEVMESIFPDSIIDCPTGDKVFHMEHCDKDGIVIFFVPHHATQELMEETLEQVIARVEYWKAQKVKTMLVLHCNYGIPDEFSNDVTLNLSEDDADYLLNECGIDYILMGHDHHSREYFDGRLRILGNTQPTSYSDIGDKYFTSYTKERGFEKHLIWEAGVRFKQLSISKDWPDLDDRVEFIDVTGEIAPDAAADTVKRIHELWDTYPNLLAVRNSVQIREINSLMPQYEDGLTSTTIHEIIDSHIKNTDMYDLWVEMTKGIQ